MPGMMDTILNLGLNSHTVVTMAKQTKNERFAYDSYRRFIHMFGSTVMNISHHDFSEALDRKKKQRKVEDDTQLTSSDL
jgi:pyruvate,orthophosphate dikinase